MLPEVHQCFAITRASVAVRGVADAVVKSINSSDSKADGEIRAFVEKLARSLENPPRYVTVWAEADGSWKLADGYSSYVVGGLIPSDEEIPHELDGTDLNKLLTFCTKTGYAVLVTPPPVEE